MRKIFIALIALIFMMSAGRVFGAQVTYNISADGIKEVNSGGVPVGDTNGFATGFITLDNGTGSGTTGSAFISLTIGNIDGTLSAHHIHEAPTTTTGSIRLDFGAPSSILTGTATAGTLNGTITGLSATQITTVFNNPTAFYYNLHTTPNFPGGAVRDQLPVPEPGSALLLMGAVGLLWRRRRA